ncbi:MAG: LptF/LptG family permease [Verrucomicrobia bacterium]|nr:LptF/LptG family permease [Verrucomicrobiota bacterium]
MKIWQRYLFFRLLKSFLFILFSIFTLFSIVDLAIRSGKIFGSHLLPDFETILYYFYQFSNYLGYFFPLALLLSSIQVLLDLNSHNELTALQMGSLSRKKLLAPFFILAGILFILSLANQQWVAPSAQASAFQYTVAHARHKKKQLREHVQTLILEDGSEMIYQRFDANKKELFDVFWIQNPSKIWHMKYFQVGLSEGRYVDQFSRGNSLLEKVASFDKRLFPEIHIDEEAAFKPFIPYEQRTLKQLAFQSLAKSGERPKLLAHLLYKFSQPLLLFLAILAIAPVTFRFSRTRSAFAVIAFALFGFVSVMMCLDGMLILAENQVLPAAIAFGAPLLAIFVLSYRPFTRKS